MIFLRSLPEDKKGPQKGVSNANPLLWGKGPGRVKDERGG